MKRVSYSKSSREKELFFHRFPKCESEKKKWKVKIRRNEGELFNITEHTRVCSLHCPRFTADDYRTTLGGIKLSRKMLWPQYFPGNTSQSALVKDKFTRNEERRGENSMQSLPGEGS